MSEDTKEKIVEGAYRALVRDGYTRATVKDIASEAGVAPGLVHYYFDTKEALLVAAIEHGCKANMLAARALEMTDPLAAAHAGFELEKEQLRSARDLYLLVFDMFGVGLHNPVIGAAVRRYIKDRREEIKLVGSALLSGLPQRPPHSDDALSAVIWGAFVGISLQKLTDAEFDSDAALDALSDMVFSYLPVPVEKVG